MIMGRRSHPACAMAVVCALLLVRYRQGAAPLAVVSMDNCSHNGRSCKNSILTMAEEWKKKALRTMVSWNI